MVGGVKELEHFPQRYVELLTCCYKNRWGFRIQLGSGVEHDLESVRLKTLQEAETVVRGMTRAAWTSVLWTGMVENESICELPTSENRNDLLMESMRMRMLKTDSVPPECAFKDKQESNDNNISALF